MRAVRNCCERRPRSRKIEDTEQIERKLLNLREDRERLGAVNLRAEEEAEAVATQLER